MATSTKHLFLAWAVPAGGAELQYGAFHRSVSGSISSKTVTFTGDKWVHLPKWMWVLCRTVASYVPPGDSIRLVVHAYQYRGLLMGVVAKVFLRLLGKKNVFVHFSERNYAPRALNLNQYSWRFEFYRRLLIFADLISCNSLDAVEIYSRYLKISRSKLVHFPNLLLGFSSMSKKQTDKNLVFGYFGRLVERKGLPLILEGFSGLDMSLLVSGDGPLRDIVQQYAHKYTNIEYLGSLQPSEFFSKIDVLLFFSTHEGCPNVVLEAVASGCLVVMNGVRGGKRELADFVPKHIQVCGVRDFPAVLNEIQLPEFESLNDGRTLVLDRYSREAYNKNCQRIIKMSEELTLKT